MGRYYHGDIEGKFWFGVQSSDDGTFFGAQEYQNTIDYLVDDIEQVKKGIEECRNNLGGNEKMLDDFFKDVHSYNEQMIIDYYKKNTHTNVEFDFEFPFERIKYLLAWYARLQLGKEILECVEKNGQCAFTAEL